MRIVAFSLVGRWAELDTGEQVPITNMIGADKEETDDPDLAISFVVGPLPDGTWMADWVENFEPAKAS